MDPALSLDSKDLCAALLPELLEAASPTDPYGPAWSGLDEGEGRDVFGCSADWGLGPFKLLLPIGGNREGTVPARKRRPADGAAEEMSFVD